MTIIPYIYEMNHTDMRFRFLLFATAAFVLTACGTKTPAEDFASYVNPKIGTGGHGHVFVGANVPFGFVQ